MKNQIKIITNVDNLKYYQIYLQFERTVCEFLEKKGYLKINLPVLSSALIPESYLEVFETEFRYFDKKEKLYLTPSPELFLKRLLAYGIGNCYYLGKSFRNAELNSSLHCFEFTMLEYYKINADYMEIADELLEMLRYVNLNLKSQNLKLKTLSSEIQNSNSSPILIKNQQNSKMESTIIYQKQKISLERWEKLTVAEAFEKYAEISEEELFNHQLFIKKARKKGYQTKRFAYEDLFSQIYVQEVEPHLGKNGYPTLIYDYPKEFAALAKLNSDGKTAQRFEFYIAGIELGDCYSELIDWREQEERFFSENKKRKKTKKINHPIDNGFIEALKYGLPDCAGIAIGFERLAMIFADVADIRQLKLINQEISL